MNQASGHDAELLELTCHFRDLRVSLRGPPDQVSEIVAVLSTHFSARDHPGTCLSESSFDFVEPSPSSAVDPPTLPVAAPEPRHPAEFVVGCESRDTIAAGFPPCPEEFLALAGKLGGSNFSGIDRIKRAWTAGQWAKAVVDSRIKTPNRSVQLDLRPRFYAVVRAPRILSPTLCHSAAAYWRIVGKIQENDSISHAFPSEVEAKIYFAGASISTFEVEQ